MVRTCVCAGVFAFALSGAAIAAEGLIEGSDSVKWEAGPSFVPKGAEMAVIAGDPGKDGLYVVRVKLPAGYKIAAHSHPKAESVTVLSGDFHIGMGDKLDTANGQALKAGGFAEAPAGMHHYAWTESGAVLQIHGEGPFAITYVDPADDPRGQMTAK